MTVADRVPLVEMRNINVAFGGVHAVDDVSIDLYAGEVVGLVGGNGAGKSTLIRVLSGAHPADSGEIRINGRKARIASPGDAAANGIALIPEDRIRQGLIVEHSVGSNIALAVLDRISESRRIIGFRNVLIHGYDVINHDVTWGIVRDKLPTLLAELDQLLK